MDADGFRQAMAKLPEPKTDKSPPYWEAWRLDLWQRAQAQDPTRFWEWPCIFHTMLINHWLAVAAYEYERLTSLMLRACTVPHFGPDDVFTFDAGLRMNLIHQAYHIQQWEQTTGQRIAALDTIVEFGGGYGAMALLCHRLGFDGKYIIYDLPEFSLLQEYYLSHFGILDKVSWNPKKKPKDVDLFMALYSLSEVEPKERLGLLPVAKSYFFLYSGRWQDWNNIDWFQFIIPARLQKQWQHTELGHLPSGPDWYSIGW